MIEVKRKAYLVFKPDITDVPAMTNKLTIEKIEYDHQNRYNMVICKAESGLNVRIELPLEICDLLRYN